MIMKKMLSQCLFLLPWRLLQWTICTKGRYKNEALQHRQYTVAIIMSLSLKASFS